ncbi:FGGY-family carbohydrate kinase [Sulfobacillus thermosulfidooxidans]|uniref:FGGY-family carbohydrate kinase n=1 Tax=Sulfobacillus thermosulfidooxidans TaxID=28034 RepID=UPI0002F634F0|nr:FGGY-family carbohydrate kinase [Sulfobacillus thermosulfidooxidans]
MTQHPIYIGVDVGTQGLRCIGWQNGRIVARNSITLITTNPRSGWAVQSASEIWEAFVTVVKLTIEQSRPYGEVRGIGLDATSSIMIVGRDGTPKSEVMLWMDVRAGQYAQTIGGLVGRPESAELPWAKALWLYDNYPHLFNELNYLVEVVDWINWNLTGEWTRSRASALLKWHATPRSDLPEWANLFPEIVQCLPTKSVGVAEKLGTVSARASNQLGLKSYDIIVAGPIIDAYAGAIGSGAIQAGSMALILGSSTCELFHDYSFKPTAGLWGPFDDVYQVGLDVLEAGQPSTGSVVRWVERNMGNSRTLEELDKMALEIEPGCGGLRVFPAFQGIRSPWPNDRARGAIHGLSLGHSVAHVIRAVYEGTSADIRRVMDTLKGGATRRIVASGGGTNSKLWLQIIADICGLPLEIADNDSVTRGAAMLAAKADGYISQLNDLKVAWPIIQPSERMGIYQDIYQKYLAEFPTFMPSNCINMSG